MNPLLDRLHPYPFERLRTLLAGVQPPQGVTAINLGIGEPQHPTPELVTRAISENLHLLGKYPATGGTPELRATIAAWLGRRYDIPTPDPDREIIPISGSREALFGFAQAVLDPAEQSTVLLPNPFYQIYEGAALLANAEPLYVPTPESNGFLPDWSAVSTEAWPRVRLVYVCSPGNPSGAVFGLQDWKALFDLSDRYGFVIAADECYSEIYTGEPPMGALQAAHAVGRSNERIVTFNSLSKRSSAPGLRSGFVAGDPAILKKYLLYRTYHGAAPSLLTQAASVAAWNDEAHVQENRVKYLAKYQLANELLETEIPAGGFFLWLNVGDGESAARALFESASLTTLPGAYLARTVAGDNPGEAYLRVALVPELDVCRQALLRIRDNLTSIYV